MVWNSRSGSKRGQVFARLIIFSGSENISCHFMPLLIFTFRPSPPLDISREEADPEGRHRGVPKRTIISDNGSIRGRQIDAVECADRIHVSCAPHLFTPTDHGESKYWPSFVQSPTVCFRRNKGVEGTIRIGSRTNRKANQKICSYILQDDNLFPWFTVLESMTLAARLKIGNKSHTYRQFMVSSRHFRLSSSRLI